MVRYENSTLSHPNNTACTRPRPRSISVLSPKIWGDEDEGMSATHSTRSGCKIGLDHSPGTIRACLIDVMILRNNGTTRSDSSTETEKLCLLWMPLHYSILCFLWQSWFVCLFLELYPKISPHFHIWCSVGEKRIRWVRKEEDNGETGKIPRRVWCVEIRKTSSVLRVLGHLLFFGWSDIGHSRPIHPVIFSPEPNQPRCKTGML